MGRDLLESANDAMKAGNWELAAELLSPDAPELSTPQGLELAAMARYGVGRFEDAVATWEQLHALLAADGDRPGAARAAAMAAMFLMMDTGMMAPVRGWLRRAERLIDGLDEAPAHALIAMTRTYERFMCGDIDGARRQSALAIELGERQGVTPAVVIGSVAAARVRILDGELEEGLDQLDEVGALLMSGRADPLTTGMMYCELICAAQGLALYQRARDWTEVMERWRHGEAFGGIHGRCRVHRAEMLRLSGPCEAAEREALGACAELRPWMRREFGWPLAELGTIRLRKGDLAGAEEALDAAGRHGWSPHPGLGRLRLRQGRTDEAYALITEAIEHPLDIPSKELPPTGELRLAPLLDAQAEIAHAAGDATGVRRAADRLRQISTVYPGPALKAWANLAEARAALIDGAPDRAISAAHAAVVAWAEVGAPFETATARTVLAEALAGNAHAARREWQAAAAEFDAYGAVDRAREARQHATPEARTDTVGGPAASRIHAVFKRDGRIRLAEMGGRPVTLRDLVGFRYIERLLAEPGREFHVLDLVAVEAGILPTGRPPVGEPTGPAEAQTGLPVLDDQARQAYRRRLADIDEDIEEATRMNDLDRIALARRDRDYLIAELERAVGLGGRHRATGSSSERARTSVTRSIRYALDRLDDHHRLLAAHLRQCVSTGTYCRYTPDPLGPVIWEL